MPAALQLLIRRAQRRKGVALIFTLVTIVLLTIIILVFFSRAQLNRQISFTSTNEVRADIFSRGAFDLILGEIREEIRVGSSTASTYNGGNASYPLVYQPNTTGDVLPKAVGIASNSSTTITKVSASGFGVYPTATRLLASNIPVSTASLNGRSISATTWGFVAGGGDGPNLGDQSTLPNWIFVTRGSGVKTPASVTTANDRTNADYVVGRFAYTVYDIGSLLNANVAGYPSNDVADFPFKASLTYADLTQFSGITQSNVDTFVGWRNAADSNSAVAYTSYLQTYAQPSGFLSTHVGDNAFLSRKDLLNFTLMGSAASLRRMLPT